MGARSIVAPNGLLNNSKMLYTEAITHQHKHQKQLLACAKKCSKKLNRALPKLSHGPNLKNLILPTSRFHPWQLLLTKAAHTKQAIIDLSYKLRMSDQHFMSVNASTHPCSHPHATKQLGQVLSFHHSQCRNGPNGTWPNTNG